MRVSVNGYDREVTVEAPDTGISYAEVLDRVVAAWERMETCAARRAAGPAIGVHLEQSVELTGRAVMPYGQQPAVNA